MRETRHRLAYGPRGPRLHAHVVATSLFSSEGVLVIDIQADVRERDLRQTNRIPFIIERPTLLTKTGCACPHDDAFRGSGPHNTHDRPSGQNHLDRITDLERVPRGPSMSSPKMMTRHAFTIALLSLSSAARERNRRYAIVSTGATLSARAHHLRVFSDQRELSFLATLC